MWAMSESGKYVQVMLPLKLDWAPYYRCSEGLEVHRGSRVRVSFAGRKYTGVALGEPVEERPEGIKNILPVEALEPVRDVREQELDFWAFLADYYLCTEGEAFRMAYPATIVKQEIQSARRREKEQARAEAESAEKERRRAENARLIAEGRKPRYRKIAAEDKAAEEKAKAEAAKKAAEAKAEETEAANRTTEAKGEEANKAAKERSEIEENLRSVSLSKAQKEAKELISKAFEKGKPVLLQGVTGSGKTEIYIALAKDTLAGGRNVLMLTPEIALEKQLEERMKEYFGSALLTFHSGETTAHRARMAEAVRNGKYIMLGTRSALFLPHTNLGLVIVDEEHDSSYKQQDPAPRYSARDCAAIMARLHGAGLLLGSATPSLESLYNVQRGLYAKVRLDERYFGGDAPVCEIIDTTAERKKNGMVGSFSRKLTALVEGRLSKGEQVLLLRTRRGYSTSMQCTGCGEIVRCPRCNVPLSFHKESNALECHYCGFHEAPHRCHKCGGELSGIGSGTQKIEEEAAALFPDARIARLDSDATPSERARIIRDFASGKTNILVGTQILTKGLDFPKLTLVASIGTDSLLGLMDFRADERAVQVLSQLRGRAGRRGGGGLLAIQTAQSGHPVFRMMKGSMSEEEFYEGMLAERSAFGFPPFTRMVNINLEDINPARLEVLSAALFKIIRSIFPGAIGPYAPQVDRIAGKYLKTIRLNLPRDRETASLKGRLRKAIREFENERKWTGHILIDADPA